METSTQETKNQKDVVITPDAMLEHWQGHRRLTRRLIEAFPEKELFSYSVGGMRPFAEMAIEMMNMALPGVHGMATGKWDKFKTDSTGEPSSKDELLKKWDMTTDEINRVWPTVPLSRFAENDRAFGQYEGPVYWTLLYFIDNEIHHRGQGFVYLRSLGIQPPPFWER